MIVVDSSRLTVGSIGILRTGYRLLDFHGVSALLKRPSYPRSDLIAPIECPRTLVVTRKDDLCAGNILVAIFIPCGQEIHATLG